ncbi:hypothetical protein ABK040_015823 [Willaertia magna]
MAEFLVMSVLFMLTFAVLSTGIFQRNFAFLESNIDINEDQNCIPVAKEKKKLVVSSSKVASKPRRILPLLNDDVSVLKESLNNYRFPPVQPEILVECPLFDVQPIQITC